MKLFDYIRSIDDFIYGCAGPIRVFFIYHNDFGLACVLPIIRLMLEDQRFKVAVIGEHLPSLNGMSMDDRGLLNECFIPFRRARFKKAHYIVSTDINTLYFKRNALEIKMGHGATFGNGDYRLKMFDHENVDVFMAQSDSEKPFLKKYRPDKYDNTCIFSVGVPKLDSLFKGEYNRSEALKDLPGDRPTILLASHWTPTSLLRTFKGHLIQCLCEEFPDFNIVQTAHNKLWEFTEEDVRNEVKSAFDSDQLYQEIKVLESQYKNFRLIKAGNCHPLLSKADVFVTDNSSIMVEYSVLDRPIVFFDSPDVEFFDLKTKQLYQNASFSFRSEKEFISMVRLALNSPSIDMEGRRALRDYFVSNLGGASQVFIDLLARFGRVSSRKEQGWNRILEMSDLEKYK